VVLSRPGHRIWQTTGSGKSTSRLPGRL